MEINLSTATRIAVTLYVLYRLYIIIFRLRLFGLWEWLFVRQKQNPVADIKPPQSPRTGVVGKAETVYLKNPLKEKVEPAPDPELLIDVDFDPDPDDIEVIDVYIPTGEDLVLPEDDSIIPDLDYSSGCTFEQLRETLGYVAAPTEDETAKVQAAETLITIRNTDVFGFIQNQVSSVEAIGRLMAECLDETGSITSAKRAKIKSLGTAGFDIDRYV